MGATISLGRPRRSYSSAMRVEIMGAFVFGGKRGKWNCHGVDSVQVQRTLVAKRTTQSAKIFGKNPVSLAKCKKQAILYSWSFIVT